MGSSRLMPWSGPASILAGALFAAKTVYDRNDAPPWPTDITDTLVFLVPLLWLVGLAGLYARSQERAGRLGRIGLGLALIGTGMAVVGSVSMSIFALDALWVVFAFGLLAQFAGLVLGGIGIWRVKVMGKASALPLIIGMLGLLMVFANPDDPNVSGDIAGLLRLARLASALMIGIGWIALGYLLWSERDGAAVRAEPVAG